MAYVGETRIYAFQFAPEGWLPCEGQLVATGDAEQLFQLIGTSFGGDGQSNFALPKVAGPCSGDEALGVCICLFGEWPQSG